MAIALEFIDFVVPILVIREKYPGGWEGCLRDHTPLIGARVWFDQHLFRDGAMNPNDIKELVDRWAALGFEPFEEVAGERKWKDMCVIESLFGGPTMPCDWLGFDAAERVAFLNGVPRSTVVSREHFRK